MLEMSTVGNDDFAAALDAIVTDETVRQEMDAAPAETLEKLGVTTAERAANAVKSGVRAGTTIRFAPPYVPVGPVSRDP
jgi:hypothetical protein